MDYKKYYDDITGYLRVSNGIVNGIDLHEDVFALWISAGKSKDIGAGDYVIVDGRKKAIIKQSLLAMQVLPGMTLIVRCLECSEERTVLRQESNGQITVIASKDLEALRASAIRGTVVKIIPHPTYEQQPA